MTATDWQNYVFSWLKHRSQRLKRSEGDFFKLKQSLFSPAGKRCVCICWTHFDIRAEPPSARQRAARAGRCREERSARSDHLLCCVCTHTFRGPERTRDEERTEGEKELISNKEKERMIDSFSLVFPRPKLVNGNWLFGFIAGEKKGPLKKALCVCLWEGYKYATLRAQ